MVVQLSILVGNVSDLIGLGYTRIEIFQSIDQGNSYQEVTASAVQAAVLDSLSGNFFQMGGRLLKLRVNGGPEQSISFSSLIQYWTPTQVANRINEVITSLATVVGTSVRLTSPTTGRASSIEVTYNDASDLGWTTGQVTYGKAARIALIGGVLLYSFTDQAGRVDDRYKWRFSANGVNPISDFSPVVSGQVAPLVDPSLLSVATARFFDETGQPRKVRLIVGVDSAPQSVGSVFVGRDQPLLVDSGDDGYLQFSLVRGAKVRVAIEGTAYIREFTVPNSTTFDLLTVMASATDPFTVQTVPPLLNRRSL